MARDRRAGRLYSLGLQRHDQLNRAFGGGLPRGSLVLVEGGYGTGKTTLAGRLAYGLCTESHTVSYLSTERPVGTFIDRMRSLSYDVTAALLDRDLLYLFGDVAGMVSEAGEPLPLLPRLTESRRMWDAEVAIVDAFGDVLRYDPGFAAMADAESRRRAAHEVVSFFRRLARADRTVVLTVDPGWLAPETLAPFRAAADVVLELTATSGGRGVRRRIDVRRFMGSGGQVDDSVAFSIRSGIGIVVENRQVV
jgi:flagellar protein FlaH